VGKFAKVMGVSRQTVHGKLKTEENPGGLIKCMKLNDRAYMIPESELKKFHVVKHGQQTWLEKIKNVDQK